MRLYSPQSQCPLEAQREGRDLRDQGADMALQPRKYTAIKFRFSGFNFGIQRAQAIPSCKNQQHPLQTIYTIVTVTTMELGPGRLGPKHQEL